LDIQETASPERRKVYPKIDRWFVTSLAQSASVYLTRSPPPAVYTMPLLMVSVRYLMICLISSTCSCPKVDAKGASDLTTEQMSSQVPRPAYIRDLIASRKG
jgi:hypothetical protein